MKLLHVYAGPFPSSQGTQTLIRQTCELLSDEGCDVHLLCYGTAQFEKTYNFTVHRIPNWPRHRGFRAGPSWSKPILDLWLALQTSRLIKKLKPDVVCPHHVEAFLAAALGAKRAKLPLAYHLHALFEPELPGYFPERYAKWAGLTGRLCDRLLPPRADLTIALADAQANALPNEVAVRTRLETVRPPFDAGDMLYVPTEDPEDNAPCLGTYVGNLDDYQNIDTLLSALAQLDAQIRKNLRFEFITDSWSQPLEEKISKLGLSPMVTVHPHGPYSNARKQLAAADFTIIPRTATGGVPIKLVNALALKVPVMLDPHLAEGIEPDEAMQVQMNDPAAIATGITQLVQSPGRRATLSIRSESAARRLFDPHRYTGRLVELYRSLI